MKKSLTSFFIWYKLDTCKGDKEMQKKKAISLIVLVITVIIMIILAGAVFITLTNARIIGQSENAVKEYNIDEVQTLASLKWSEAYMNMTGKKDPEVIKNAVMVALTQEGVDLNKYGVIIKEDGVKAYVKGEFWEQNGVTVTNGVTTLQVGDSIEYDETNGGAITGLTETDWKVLGANEQGELLIMSTKDVTSYTLGYAETTTDDAAKLTESQNSWLNGASVLDNQCKAYGQGKGATSARSINADDVNNVTGYKPEVVRCGIGALYEYGNTVTYTYNNTVYPKYEGKNGITGDSVYIHDNGFHYYNGTDFVTVNDLLTGKSGTTIAVLQSSRYYYYPHTLTVQSTGVEKGIAKDSKAYIMLFRNEENTSNAAYWLATKSVNLVPGYARYEMRTIRDGIVTGDVLWASNTTVVSVNRGVRAVVTIAPNVEITGSSASGWSI